MTVGDKAHQTQLAPVGEARLSESTAAAAVAAERNPVEAVTVHTPASCSMAVPEKGWTALPAISAGSAIAPQPFVAEAPQYLVYRALRLGTLPQATPVPFCALLSFCTKPYRAW